MKTFLLSFLVLLPLASHSMNAEKGVAKMIPLYTSDWKFLKEKFITIPQSKFALTYPKLRRTISVMAPLIVASPYAYVGLLAFFLMPEGQIILPAIIIALLGSLYVTNKTCSVFNNYYLNYLEKSSVMEFIANWPRNKKHSPVEVHAFFDDIYKDYKTNAALITPDLAQIMIRIKAEIQKHFAKTS